MNKFFITKENEFFSRIIIMIIIGIIVFNYVYATGIIFNCICI